MHQAFTWTQTLDEVHIKSVFSNGIAKSQVRIVFRTSSFQFLHDKNEVVIDGHLFGDIVPDESTWYIDDGITVYVVLQKAHSGETWTALCRDDSSSSLSILESDEIKKKLLLERFEKEHSGLDFSGAKFNGGDIPDPRTFLGGYSTVN